ncbi:MAG: hypothetical protein CVU59_09885 [Deltaproteobacteria bacterium HGW-Deltaproteobacteria-17]|nr:MAG: hypothetical protein CVU59_09885 [Deltaproteobacteria bacterium HGW-Deltaproteobacteria-17]
MIPSPEPGPGDPLLVPLTIQVDPGARGLRADLYLAGRLGRISRARIQAMFGRGHVRCGDQVLRASRRLHGDELLTVYKPAPPQERPMPHVPVVFRDRDIVVVDKPGDLTVHPTANAFTRTLTAFLQGLDGGPFHPAHRLDRETSGLVICGRPGPVSAALKAQFSERTTRKIYVALVHGPFDAATEVFLPLDFARSSPIRIKMEVTRDGAPAASTFLPLWSGDPASLIACIPHTGRQHQLRAHLEWCDHPICGDKIYGVPPECFLEFIETGWTPELAGRLLFPRHMLHAAFLRITHPVSGEPLEFFTDVPADLRAACAHFGVECPPAEVLLERLRSVGDLQPGNSSEYSRPGSSRGRK